MNQQRPAGWLVDGGLLMITLIWGATFVLVKRALADASTLLFLTIRFAGAAFVLALVFRKAFRAGKLGVSLRGGMLAGLCLFGGYVFQTVGLRYTSASKAAFITGFTTPLVALLGSILYRRAPLLAELLGVAIAFRRNGADDHSRRPGSISAGRSLGFRMRGRVSRSTFCSPAVSQARSISARSSSRKSRRVPWWAPLPFGGPSRSKSTGVRF